MFCMSLGSEGAGRVGWGGEGGGGLGWPVLHCPTRFCAVWCLLCTVCKVCCAVMVCEAWGMECVLYGVGGGVRSVWEACVRGVG